MGFITILTAIAILYLLSTLLNRSSEQQRLLESLYDKIKDLNKEVASLYGELREHKTEPVINPVFKKPATDTLTPVKPQPVKEAPVIPVPRGPAPPQPLTSEKKDIAVENSIKITPPSSSPAPAAREKDLEKYIGENLISKIGITILILGISFFIKYAIDKNWVNESGRVIVGFTAGGILLFIAHRLRNTYRSFSSVLVGGGLTVFYFSTAFAFHQYHLIGQTTAFVTMVCITAFAVFLSVFYNRLELAILAVIGAFITPFLASAGNENYIALFVYLSIVNGGIIALSWFKCWPVINSIALFFTTFIFGGWLLQRTAGAEKLFPQEEAILFATVFYILFTLMHIINSTRLKSKLTAFDCMMVSGTNGLYYLAGMSILSYAHQGKGLFTLILGLFNLLLSVIFYKQKRVDVNFTSLVMAISLTFISLALPIQFSGNHMVLFWAAESVILLWMFRRSNINLLFYASLVTVGLCIGGLLINWANIYFLHADTLPILLNKAFITALFTGISLAAYYTLLQKVDKTEQPGSFKPVNLINTLLVTLITVVFLAGLLEIYYQFTTRMPRVPVHFIYMGLYTFIAAIIIQHIFRKSKNYPLLKAALTILCMGIFISCISQSAQLSMHIAGTDDGGWFFPYWIATGLLIGVLFDTFRYFFPLSNEPRAEHQNSSMGWLLSVSCLVVLSAALFQGNIWINLHNNWIWWKNLYYKAGLSILWGVFSFILMWTGMKYKHRVLRIISLSLFTITIAKLFIFDIRNIPPGGKIAAFILLGILLLVVSFMYQRLKKIIMDNQVE